MKKTTIFRISAAMVIIILSVLIMISDNAGTAAAKIGTYKQSFLMFSSAFKICPSQTIATNLSVLADIIGEKSESERYAKLAKNQSLPVNVELNEPTQ